MPFQLKRSFGVNDWCRNWIQTSNGDIYVGLEKTVEKSTDGGSTFSPIFSDSNTNELRIFVLNDTVFKIKSYAPLGLGQYILMKRLTNSWQQVAVLNPASGPGIGQITDIKVRGAKAYFACATKIFEFNGVAVTEIATGTGFSCVDATTGGDVYWVQKAIVGPTTTSTIKKWNGIANSDFFVVPGNTQVDQLIVVDDTEIYYISENKALSTPDNKRILAKIPIAAPAEEILNNTLMFKVQQPNPGGDIDTAYWPGEMVVFDDSLFIVTYQFVAGFTGGNAQVYVWDFDDEALTLFDSITGQSVIALTPQSGLFNIVEGDPQDELVLGVKGRFISTLSVIPEPVNEGDFMEVPMMNSLHFVKKQMVNNCTIFPTMDNTLFCNQKDFFPGFTWKNYYQKVAKCDPVPIQFYSNYTTHEIELRNYITDALVDNSFPVVLKESNLNNEQEFVVFLTAHTGAQSRVYFQVGAIPIPVTVGQNFTIFNSVDGYNGDYTIEEIQNDILLGQQYLVINKIYTGPGASSDAQARFLVSTQPFNVYEFVLNTFLVLPDGFYYVKIKGTSGTPQEWDSEPISLKVQHPGTVYIQYRNYDNAYDFTYTTGIVNRIRVESTFFKRLPDGEDDSYRNVDTSKVKLKAKRFRGFLIEFWQLPPYLHEKLSVIFGHDVIFINGVRYQTDEKYEEPKYITRYPLSNSQIKIEQYGWFDKYNSDDIGPVDGSDGGFIIANGGFLKR